jgi:hypothetical protein
MLSVEELDLIEFLVAQVASLSSSLTCKVATVESSTPPPLAREAVFLQPDMLSPQLPPPPSPIVPAAGDVLVGVVRTLTSPLVALELQVIGIGEALKEKPPDIAALEVSRKGTAFMCGRRSARLASVVEGLSRFWFLVVLSPARWS